MKKSICALLCLCLLLGLSSCGRRDIGPEGNYEPLPAAQTDRKAPDGDEEIHEEVNRILFLPSSDGLHLVGRTIQLLRAATEGNEAEKLVQALLSAEGDETTSAVGGQVKLQLFGNHPVEVSNGICTVNLSSSALQLESNELYTAGLAIAATLCELDEIQYVNILVADQAVGLDIMGNLPMGSLNARPGEDLTVLWEQMDARKTPLGQDPANTAFTGVATLYFPVGDGSGIMPETRTISFGGQSPQIMALTLLEALSNGNRYLSDVPVMPDLKGLLTHDPLVSELDDGGRLVTLAFAANTEGVLKGLGIEMPCMMASVVYTLTTFVPGITAVSIRIGENLMTSVYTEIQGSVLFPGGIQKRDQFEKFLVSRGNIYLSTGTKLRAVKRTFARGTECQPRALLETLMVGPTESEKTEGICNALPEGLNSEDVLGVLLDGDVLSVNLTERFAEKIREAGKEREQQTVYSMVNTLCLSTGARYVYFFFEGEQRESIAGVIYWGGNFLVNPGMIEENNG